MRCHLFYLNLKEAPSMVATEAFCTLVTSDDYGLGAIVLAHSLRDVGTTKELICMYTDKVTGLMVSRLREVFGEMIHVAPTLSKSLDNLKLLGRPDLIETFTKINVWNLTQYEKIVFLDADTIVKKNVDDLFSVNAEFSACPDIGWPDCFNSGVFVLKPSKETYSGLLKAADTTGSFDGGDQGLLNDFFPNWNRLSYVYNVTPAPTTAHYSYAPAVNKYKNDIRIVHFVGTTKPWHTRSGDYYFSNDYSRNEFISFWWSVHDKHIGKWVNESLKSDDGCHQPPSQHCPSFGERHENDSRKTMGDQIKSNPFFKSRYEWNEAELGSKAKTQKLKSVPVNEMDENDSGQKIVPLKTKKKK
jgi:alpha-N-acetylglucosamine transferase